MVPTDALTRFLTDKLRGFTVALPLLLLEELVAGVGAGQEEPETLWERAQGFVLCCCWDILSHRPAKRHRADSKPSHRWCGGHGMPPRDSLFSRKPPQNKVHHPAPMGRTSNCKKGFFCCFVPLGVFFLHLQKTPCAGAEVAPGTSTFLS